MIELKNLGFERKGRWLFRSLSFKVAKGSIISILGPSGVGKSTLLKVIGGVLPPSEGEVAFHNHLSNVSRREISFIHQSLLLTQELSSLQNVLVGRLGDLHWSRSLFGFPSGLKSEASHVLKDFGLNLFLDTPVGRLSGGERQRVAIARSLFQQSSIILADEPIATLDPVWARYTMRRLHKEAKEFNRVVVVVLHDRNLATQFSDFVIDLTDTFEG